MFKLKRVAVVLATVLAAAAGAVAVTPSAALAGTSGTRIARAGMSTVFMEVSGWSTSAGALLDEWGPNSGSSSRWDTGANQEWSLPTNGHGGIDTADGYIENEYSHMCITTDGIKGHAIYQAPCNGGVYQEWNFQGFYFFDWLNFDLVYYFHIVNPLSGLALNASGGSFANGTTIIGWPLSGQNTDNNESWGIFL